MTPPASFTATTRRKSTNAGNAKSSEGRNERRADEKLPTSQSARWERRIRDLRAFREAYGHVSVSTRDAENAQLGNWVHIQRVQYKAFLDGGKTHLTRERVRELDREQFVWDGTEAQWTETLEDLRRYRRLYGNAMVPRSEGKLGRWVHNQRSEYRYYLAKKPSLMTEERIRLLEEEGFVWNMNDYRWQKMFQHVVAFKNTEGGWPAKKDKDSIALFNWVKEQRREYKNFLKNGKSTLSKYRIDALNQEKFIWDPWELQWQSKLAAVQDFKLQNKTFPTNSHTLGLWLRRQNLLYEKMQNGKKSSMTMARIKALESIGYSL